MIKVKVLQVCAVLQGFGEVLGALTLNFVTHEIQTDDSDGVLNEITKDTGTQVGNLVISQIDLINIKSIFG